MFTSFDIAQLAYTFPLRWLPLQVFSTMKFPIKKGFDFVSLSFCLIGKLFYTRNPKQDNCIKTYVCDRQGLFFSCSLCRQRGLSGASWTCQNFYQFVICFQSVCMWVRFVERIWWITKSSWGNSKLNSCCKHSCLVHLWISHDFYETLFALVRREKTTKSEAVCSNVGGTFWHFLRHNAS